MKGVFGAMHMYMYKNTSEIDFYIGEWKSRFKANIWDLFRKWDEFEPFFIPAVIANIKKYASLIEFYTLNVFMFCRYRRIFV